MTKEFLSGIADLHMHTTVSDGTMSPQAVVNEVVIQNLIAERSGNGKIFDVIAITDHDAIQGALVAEDYLFTHFDKTVLQIIIGAEISSSDGHILALNIKKDIPANLSAEETIDAIHKQGGLAIAAHPYAYIPFLKGLKGIGKLIYDENVGRKLDAVEIRNANPTETINNYIAQLMNALYFNKPVCGGSDSHFQTAIGKAYTLFDGHTKEDLFSAIKHHSTKAGGNIYGPIAIYHYIHDRLKWKQFCLADPIHRVYHDW